MMYYNDMERATWLDTLSAFIDENKPTWKEEFALELEQISLVHPPIKKPFKWVGSKQSLLQDLAMLYPRETCLGQTKWIEPFLGSGAALLDRITTSGGSVQAICGDVNPSVIAVWSVLQTGKEMTTDSLWYQMLTILHGLIQEYESQETMQEKEAIYKHYRAQFNLRYQLHNDGNVAENAAWFLFLNRTCFNGLWRVNRSNQLNSPWGKKETVNFGWEDFFWSLFFISRSDINFHNQDYVELCMGLIESLDEPAFFFFDPPYRPTKESPVFSQYCATGFKEERLAKLCEALDEAGHKWMMCNSYQPEYFRGLFQSKFNRWEGCVSEGTTVAAKGGSRGRSKTLLLTNYDPME